MLKVLSMPEFGIWQSYESGRVLKYANVSQRSEYARIFLAWESSEYISGSKYVSTLNMKSYTGF